MEKQTIQKYMEAGGEVNTIEILVSALSFYKAKVKFLKKDGSERIMKCTRSMELIPIGASTSTKQGVEREASSNPNLISVFDLEAQGWRSFDFTRLIEFEIDSKD